MERLEDKENMDDQSSLQRFLKDDLFRWKVVALHFIFFSVSMALLGIILVRRPPNPIISQTTATADSQIAFPLFSVLWVALLALHFIFTVSNENERDKQKQLSEKPKRQFLEVGDDGELVEVIEADEAEEKGKNRTTSY
jgi:hypothetical protein